MMKPEQTAKEIALELLQAYGTQQAVAEALGVSQPTVSKWLSSEGAPMRRTTRLLATRLLNERKSHEALPGE